MKIPEPLHQLLSKLRNVKRTGPEQWMASSPLRDDNNPSLAINRADDGKILIYDHAEGLDATEDVLAAVGMSIHDLFPTASPAICSSLYEQLVPSVTISKRMWPYLDGFTKQRAIALSKALGLPAAAMDDFEVGYSNKHGAYAVLETDAFGGPVGIQYRCLDGRKFFERGGKRGLAGTRTLLGSGTLIICEGWTDAAAISSLGFTNTVARPSATARPDLITQLIKAGTYHDAIIVADPKPQEQVGAAKLGEAISGLLPYRIVTPPDMMDARAWVNKGATRSDVESLFSTTPPKTNYRQLSLVQIEQLPKPAFQIEDLFPVNSFVVLYGAYASGKSFVALDWALSIQAGIDWVAGRRGTKKGQAVYVAGEGTGGLGARAKYWRIGHEKTTSAVAGATFVVDAPKVDDADAVGKLISDLKLLPTPPSLIVLDTLARTIAGNENDTQDMGAYVEGADRLRKTFNCTVVVVHHPGKDESRGTRGSTALDCAADVKVRIARCAKNRSVIKVTCEKQKDYVDFEPFYVALHCPDSDPAGSAWLIAADPPGRDTEDREGPGTASLPTFQVLVELSGEKLDWVARQAWAKKTGLRKDTFNNHLPSLKQAGLVEERRVGKIKEYRPRQNGDVTSVTDVNDS